MNINEFHPTSGRFVKEDGTTVNIADALGGESVTDKIYDINNMMPHSGRFIKEDGTTVNIADMIANGDIGGGGGGSSDDSAPPIVETYNGQVIQCSMGADRPLKGLNLYATCKQDSTSGAQLIPYWENGWLNGNGEETSASNAYRTGFIDVKPNTTYTLRMPNASLTTAYIWLFENENDAAIDYQSMKSGKIEIPQNVAKCRIGITTLLTEPTENSIFYEGTETKQYEPYTGGIPSPNVDYPQEIQTISDFTVEVKNSMGGSTTPQTLNITIPEQGFYGIPVKSGGNYTDSSGQQWICDEFDFKNKKFIKRVGRVSYDGAENEEWVLNAAAENKTRFYINLANGKIASSSKCLCNRLIYGISGASGACFVSNSRFYIDIEASINTVALLRDYLNTHPLDVIYPLETPVEYNLTDAEIEQYKKLRSYYKTTYIDNDAVPVCNMTADIVVDTKMYIDSKLSS